MLATTKKSVFERALLIPRKRAVIFAGSIKIPVRENFRLVQKLNCLNCLLDRERSTFAASAAINIESTPASPWQQTTICFCAPFTPLSHFLPEQPVPIAISIDPFHTAALKPRLCLAFRVQFHKLYPLI